jgi:hypothetical protein
MKLKGTLWLTCTAFLYTLMISCCKKETSKFLILDLSNAKKNKLKIAYGINNFATEIKYIPLQETQVSLLSGVEKLDASSDYFFILDREMLFQFKKNGTFTRQIGKKGKGPNEFSCFDFDIDINNKVIYILDYFQDKIVKYNFEGQFIKSYHNPVTANEKSSTYRISYLKYLGNGQILLSTNSNTLFPETYLFNEQTKVLKQLQKPENTKTTEGSLILPNNKIFYNYDGELYCKHMFSDTIYHYSSDGKVSPHFLICCGKSSLGPNDLNSFENFPPQNSLMISNIEETDYFIIINYTYFIDRQNRKILLAYYDKHNPYPYSSLSLNYYIEKKNQEVMNKRNFKEDRTWKLKDSRIDGQSSLFYAKDQSFYQVRMPDKLSKDVQQQYKLNENNNPCIILYTLNKKALNHK